MKKFRVRTFCGEIKKEGVFIGMDGTPYEYGLHPCIGLSPILNAKVEVYIGRDSLGNEIYENDILLSEYSVYTAGFDLETGACIFTSNGGKIPFKQCVEKLVLREKK